ncbi:hypothetical protein FGIG_10521 [Fasciola gigantica]|uniref:IQ calmodulin-binding motif-containing protein 1 n=1 Tax=Fasciola gigantica TaxID=46835 RepID=A0A504YC80_FASGI|nr:hypothetical protein FGIG_10521 [Fasciola gigantica]
MSKSWLEDISLLEDRLYNLHFTDDLSVVSALTKLQNSISRVDSQEKLALQCRLFQFNVPQLICASLKQDFSRIPGGWDQAVIMCGLLVSILEFGTSRNQSKPVELSDDLITETVNSILILLRRLQKRSLYLKRTTQSDLSSEEVYHFIDRIINHLHQIMQFAPQTALLVVDSPWFLQLFIVDDPQLMAVFISLLVVCIQIQPNILQQMEQSQKVSILDELVYHFAVLDSLETVNHTLNCLLVFLGCETQLRTTILKRYRGIQLLVARWIAQLCDSNKSSPAVDSQTKKMLLSLKSILGEFRSSAEVPASTEPVTEKPQEQLDEQQAAKIIQSHWRGHYVRRLLRNANRAISNFQRKYRERQNERDSYRRKQRIEQELQQFVKTTRRRRWREKLEMELNLLSSLPAPLVDREQSRQQTEAAVRIQAAYRGYQVRCKLGEQQTLAMRNKAARIIQSWYRSHLSRRECLQAIRLAICASPSAPRGQIDAKKLREQTLERHRGWTETNPSVPMNREKLEELHRTTQLRLRAFYLSRMKAQQQAETRRVNLARMAMDAELLLGEPTEYGKPDAEGQSRLARAVANRCRSPADSNNKDNRFDVEPFRCRVQPIAKLAQDEHRQCLSRLGRPWWTVVMREWNKKSVQWLLANEAQSEMGAETVQNEHITWSPDDLFDTSKGTSVVDDYERTFQALGVDNEPILGMTE